MKPSLLDLVDTQTQIELRLQDAVELLSSLENNSVPLVLTDPPYGISYQSNRSAAKSAPIAQDWNFQIGPFLSETARVLKPDGAAYVFTRWDVFPLWHRALPPTLKMRNLIVWVKDNHSAGDLAGNFGFKWEAIMMLTREKHVRRGHRYSNVWEFARVPSSKILHPAEKPVPLLTRIIECATDKGDLVVDPFTGSGSTGEAAVLTGRQALLGDIDPRTLRVAAERLRLPLPTDAPKTRVEDNTPPKESEVCLDALDGIHPEDLAEVIVWLKSR
jgi:site-specific DNA-methyltransferase (adenine-specific)